MSAGEAPRAAGEADCTGEAGDVEGEGEAVVVATAVTAAMCPSPGTFLCAFTPSICVR